MNKFILLEDKQVKKALEIIKNDLDKKPSVINKTNITEKEVGETEIITEGLKFFKVSKRLDKLSNKILKKSKNPTLLLREARDLVKISRKVKKLSEKFERAEDLYDIGKKAQARAMEKELKSEYLDLLKILKKSETVDLLKKVGSFAMVLIGMTVPYMLLNKFFPSLSFAATNSAVAAETNAMKQAGLYLKRAGAFALCGIPTKAVGSVINNAGNQYDDLIIKAIDKKIDLV